MGDEMQHEQLATYALDALDDDERVAFEQHLATCPQCREDLAGMREAAAALVGEIEPVDPPAELRGRILDAARAERPNVVPLRPKRLSQPLVWVAGIAAAAAVVFAVWGVTQNNSLGNERDARKADQRALAVLADPQAHLTALKGGTGTLAVTPDGRAVLTVAHLPKAPSGKTYEAWVIPGSAAPQRAGLLSGGTTSTLYLGRPVPAGSVVAVTVERSGGVNAPTGTPLFTASRA